MLSEYLLASGADVCTRGWVKIGLREVGVSPIELTRRLKKVKKFKFCDWVRLESLILDKLDEICQKLTTNGERITFDNTSVTRFREISAFGQF